MSNTVSFQEKVYQLIEPSEEGHNRYGIFDKSIMALILLNILAIILESYHSLQMQYAYYFYIFEIFSVIVFSIEYVLRLLTAHRKYKKKNSFFSVVHFIKSPMGIVDLLAILPFYLPLFIPFDLRFLRVLRATRLLRVFKLKRYSRSLEIVGKVLKDTKDELIVTVFITFLLLLIASTLMFYLEGNIQPDAFPNILSTFWWAIATLTTIGYGDVYPLTAGGRVLASIIAILGIGLVALPTGIISTGFIEEWYLKKGKMERLGKCPHCAKSLRQAEKKVVKRKGLF